MTEDSAPLPAVIQQYQDAHDRHDIDAALATFTATATVIDEDRVWTGTDEIKTWLAETSSKYAFTRTLLGAHADGEQSWLVRHRLEGNFPGNVVDLRYRFSLDGDRIASLRIAP
jgi:hypothetical protein